VDFSRKNGTEASVSSGGALTELNSEQKSNRAIDSCQEEGIITASSLHDGAGASGTMNGSTSGQGKKCNAVGQVAGKAIASNIGGNLGSIHEQKGKCASTIRGKKARVVLKKRRGGKVTHEKCNRGLG